MNNEGAPQPNADSAEPAKSSIDRLIDAVEKHDYDAIPNLLRDPELASSGQAWRALLAADQQTADEGIEAFRANKHDPELLMKAIFENPALLRAMFDPERGLENIKAVERVITNRARAGYEKQISDSDASIKQFQDAFNHAARIRDGLEAEIAEKDAKLTKIVEENKWLYSEVDRRDKEHAEHTKKIDELSTEIRNLRGANTHSGNEMHHSAKLAEKDAEIAEKDELIAQLYRTLETLPDVLNKISELSVQIEEHTNIAEKNATNQPDAVDHTRLINERDAKNAELELQLEKLRAEINEASQLATETIDENNAIEAKRADITTEHIEDDPKPATEAKLDIQQQVSKLVAIGNVEKPGRDDWQKLSAGVYREIDFTGSIQITKEYYNSVRDFASKVIESSDNNVREQALKNLRDKVREMINQSNQHANIVAARAGETSGDVFEKRDGAEKSDTRNTINILIARGNQEVPNEPKWKQLYVGVYRNIYLLTDGYEFHGEKYDEVVQCAKNVVAGLENADESELTTLQSNLYDAINNILNRQIPKPSVGEATGIVGQVVDPLEQAPKQKLSIEDCPLESIVRGKPGINAEIIIKGSNLAGPFSAYLIDKEGQVKVPFGEVKVISVRPNSIKLKLNNIKIPDTFSPFEYSGTLVVKLGQNEVRQENIDVK